MESTATALTPRLSSVILSPAMERSGILLREHHLARQLADQLQRAGLILPKPKQDWLTVKIEAILVTQAQSEMKVDTDAKELLSQYQKEMDSSAVDTRKMFTMIKKKLIRDRNLILQSDPTIEPEDKINHLAHVIENGLTRDKEVEIVGDPTHLLRDIKRILTTEQAEEQEVHRLVRTQLAHAKVLEGTEKWDLTYQKTFTDMMKKRGR
jgi:hypothetical protein